MVLVSKLNLPEVLKQLTSESTLSLDTETTGLYPYLGDKLFALIIASAKNTYYFNFHDYSQKRQDAGFDSIYVLSKEILARELTFLFSNTGITWFMHNAKFDLGMLASDGVEISGKVHCTEAAHRLIENDLLSYSLDSLAKKIGEKKSDAVEEYISKHKLYSWETVPGKKARFKNKRYIEVPHEIMIPYGEQDAKVTFKLGLWQIMELQKIAHSHSREIFSVYENELRLTKTCFAMEKVGIKINTVYVKEALEYEQEKISQATAEFEARAGVPFKDSNRNLADAFSKLGEEFPLTEKGNPSFTDEVLEGFSTPLAAVVRKYRAAYKRANTYYQNFLQLADSDDFVHANLRQSGTASGRMSCANPNLQNLHKEEDPKQPYLVRRSFIPEKDFVFVPIDYDQMEYRMMVDYAAERQLIELIKSGLDVHEATAQKIGMGVTRQQAKTLNFMLLYGGGVETLAGKLGVKDHEARAIRDIYFRQLPEVCFWRDRLIKRLKYQLYIKNWMGRVYKFKADFAYKGPNYLIQGGCADVVKVAMNRCFDFLKGKKSYITLQIHDEILFSIHKDELELVGDLKNIMENVYQPLSGLNLTCSVDHSWVSWGDKIKGSPVAIRDVLQGESAQGFKNPTKLLVHQDSAAHHFGYG